MSIFLTAEWLDLALLNFAVEPALLEVYVPRGTALDVRGGRAFVSVVGFRFLRTRVLGARAVLHEDFDEVNLRLYVVRDVSGARRHGVVFLREIVARPVVALLARALYNEPYRLARVRHRSVRSADGFESLEYGWRAERGWCFATAASDGPAYDHAAGSDEEYFTQREWGYTRQRDGGTIEYRVEHPRWRVWRARSPSLEGDFTDMFPPPLVPVLRRVPQSAFIAAGSAVTVHRGVRI